MNDKLNSVPGWQLNQSRAEFETRHQMNDYLLPDHWICPRDTLFWLVHEAYVRRAVSIVVEAGAKRVLEVGCGDGWNCGVLVDAGVQVVGIDRSRNGIEHARRMVPGAQFLHCDVRDDDFRKAFPQPFDAVLLIEVIEHIPPADCPEALRAISSVLRPGGLLVLTTPSVNTPNQNPQHYRHFSEPLLRDTVLEAGCLVIKSITGYGDALKERRYWRLCRWCDNRFYTIKPVRRWLTNRHRRFCLDTALARSAGLILVAELSV